MIYPSNQYGFITLYEVKTCSKSSWLIQSRYLQGCPNSFQTKPGRQKHIYINHTHDIHIYIIKLSTIYKLLFPSIYIYNYQPYIKINHIYTIYIYMFFWHPYLLSPSAKCPRIGQAVESGMPWTLGPQDITWDSQWDTRGYHGWYIYIYELYIIYKYMLYYI